MLDLPALLAESEVLARFECGGFNVIHEIFHRITPHLLRAPV